MTGGASDRLVTEAGEPIGLDHGGAFVWPVTAEPGDIDGQGHVNNAVYVRWMDQAAAAHSAAVGYDAAAYRAMGTAFVVRRHEVDYLAEALAGQRLAVATWAGPMRRFAAQRYHQIVRLTDGATLVRARTQWVYLDRRTGRPTRMPADLIAAFGPIDSLPPNTPDAPAGLG